MEEELKNIEKQRRNIYKQQLKEQAFKHNKDRIFTQSYMKRRETKNNNELIEKLKANDDERMINRKNTQKVLKNQNEEMLTMKKSIFNFDKKDANDNKRDKSLMDRLNEGQTYRNTKNIHELKDQTQDNSKFVQLKRNVQGKIKSVQKLEDQKHLNRINELQEIRRRNKSNLLKKHSQNMSIYDRHNEIMKNKDVFQKQLQKFTDAQNDILHNLRRNEALQRRKMTKQYQEQNIRQMQNRRKANENIEGIDMKKSLFQNMLRERPDYSKQVAKQLQVQMGQYGARRNEEKQYYHLKHKVSGVIGGQHGPERINQIRIVDGKLGINHNLNRSQQLQSYNPQQLKEKVEISRQKPKTPTSKGNISQASQERPGSIFRHQNIASRQSEVENKKNVFRSYDFITGKTRFYGDQ